MSHWFQSFHHPIVLLLHMPQELIISHINSFHLTLFLKINLNIDAICILQHTIHIQLSEVLQINISYNLNLHKNIHRLVYWLIWHTLKISYIIIPKQYFGGSTTCNGGIEMLYWGVTLLLWGLVSTKFAIKIFFSGYYREKSILFCYFYYYVAASIHRDACFHSFILTFFLIGFPSEGQN